MSNTKAEKEAAKAAKLAEKEAAKAARGSAEGAESEPEEEDVDDQAEAAAEDTDAEDGSDEVTVRYRNPSTGMSDRIFSREIHGDKFRTLAKLFREKTGGEILK